MRKLIKSLAAAAVVLMVCTACSRSIDTAKIEGNWVCTTEDGTQLRVTLTDRTFTQSSGEAIGETLKYERTSDGVNVKAPDGKSLLKLTFSEQDGTISYTVNGADGSEHTYTFTREAQCDLTVSIKPHIIAHSGIFRRNAQLFLSGYLKNPLNCAIIYTVYLCTG